MARARAPRIFGAILKLLFSLLILLVCTILIWRVFFSARIPKEVKGLSATPAVTEAYATYGEDLICRYQDQASITRAEKNYGYFSVSQVIFLPQANELQLVFRYNNSTIQHLTRDYQLERQPEKAETLFDLTLFRTTQNEPENYTRFFPSEQYTARTETQLYTYIRYVFEGVTIEDATEGLFLDIYYVGDKDYDKEAYGVLCLYDYTDTWLPYQLTAADKKLLGGAMK